MFKVGDKVRIKPSQKNCVKKEYRSKQGKVTHFIGTNSTKQHCRVNFGKGIFDYEDVGSWRLELV
jgi:hypothetical protein